MPNKWQEEGCRLRIEPVEGGEIGVGAASELVRKVLMIQTRDQLRALVSSSENSL